MITTVEQAISTPGDFRAGGTDYMDRVRHHLIGDSPIDLHQIPGLDSVETDAEGRVLIGALTTMFNIAQTPILREQYAGLAEAAGALATPQIRQIGTIGGNLTQATRCQYYRHPHLPCIKKGDAICGCREGHNPNGVIFDNGGSPHPHPSTLGMALMAYNAEIEINGKGTRSIFDLYDDGSDPSRDHLLAEGELITRIILPAGRPGEKAAYFRASARARAEWAIVECVARLQLDGEQIQQAFVAVGGVGPVPLRLVHVEAALNGQPATAESFAKAVPVAAEGANPLPQTGYKVPLLINSVEETLLKAVGLDR